MSNKTQQAVSSLPQRVWWQRLWAVLPAAMLSCGLFLAATTGALYAPGAEAATTCGTGNTYATTSPNNCKLYCQTQANFAIALWTTYCNLPAGAGFCNDATRVGAYTSGTSWFTKCGLTPATAYANAVAKPWCQTSGNFGSALWNTNCQPGYCSDGAVVGTANFFLASTCAAGGTYVSPPTKAWCDAPANYGTAAWNTNCQAPYCAAAANVGTAVWLQTNTCGGPTPYTSTYTGSWCKNSANFGDADWPANCRPAYCADQTQGAVAGGAWFTQCGVPAPYTAPGTSTWCANSANFGTANWNTYCQAGYCADGTKVGTAAWFATNTCGAGGAYVSPTTKAWCDTPANFGTAAWTTNCKTGYCAAVANAGTASWFLTTTCGGPTAYTSTTTGPWCKNPANFGNANWASNCGVAYCADQTQGAVAGGAWFTQCGVPAPYTAPNTSTWCANSANFGTANWNTYCKAAYCADGTKVGTAAWFATNTCGTGGVYVSPTTKAWCDTPANYGTATWNTQCKTGYCAAAANAGTSDWFLTTTCGGPAPYTSTTTGPWCKASANFGNALWAANCGTAYCADQTQGSVAGGAWFTQCGVPTAYTGPATGTWCANAANFGTTNWNTYCKASYCVDAAKINTPAWFGSNTCGTANPFTSPDTGSWCQNVANYDTANWTSYCQSGYCADTTQGDVNIPPVTASPAAYVPVTPNWFSRCAAAGTAHTDPDTAPWCSSSANFSGGNRDQWIAYCNTGWCANSANYNDVDWIGNCNNNGGWCDAKYIGLSARTATEIAQWFTACQASVCQSPTPVSPANAVTDATYFKYACTCPNAAWINASSCAVGTALLAQYPLELGGQVQPNLLILQDDSGSMDWESISDYPNGMFYPGRVLNPNLGTCGTNATTACSGGGLDAFSYMFRTAADQYTDTTYGNTLWPNEMDEAIVGQAYQPQAGWVGAGKGPWGFWRGRSASFNRMYYNPNVTYNPWKGVDTSGLPFANSSPTAAPLDPYRPTTGGTVNLTTVQAVAGHSFKDKNGTNWTPSPANFNLYIPTYYLWTDTNTAVPAEAGNGAVDAKDTHVKVEVKAATTSYTVGSLRKDCAAVVAGGTTCSYTEEIQNFANWFTYYRNRFLMAKGSLGEVIWPENKLRMGVSFIDGSGGVALTDISTTPQKNTMLQGLYKEDYNGVGTPLRTALDKAGKYFMCASGDIYGSAASSAPGTATCPLMSPTSVLPWNKGQGKCQQNYTLLTTDGFWNGGAPAVGNADGGTATNYNRGAFGDTSSNTLADVAMYYYQTDLWGTLADEVPPTATDRLMQVGGTPLTTAMHQHMATFTIGFGVQGELTDAQVATIEATPTVAANPVWPAPTADALTTADDLTHAAFNGRGQYLNASSTTELQAALNSVFDNILAGASSATKLTFNTQNLSTNTVTFNATFNTIDSTGDLVAKPILFACALGTSGPGCPQVKSIGSQVWSAAAMLDSKAEASRVLVTYNRVSGKAVPFTTAAYALASGTGAWSPIMKATLTSQMVEYLRGMRCRETGLFCGAVAGTMRPRPATSGLLGDIVNSSPVYVGVPPFIDRDGWKLATVPYSTFKGANVSRTPLVYVGANDGILHAFDAATGSEVFGYVPGHLFDVTASADTLDKLTSASYQHHFYVDLTPTQQDVFYGGAWHSILVGGFRAGGKGYFALDVTDPSTLNSATGVISNFLWEHTDVEDTDMGYSFSHPVAGFFNDGGTYVVVGNGYGSANNEAALILMSVAANTTTGQPSTIKKVHTGAFGTGTGLQPLNGLGDIRTADLNADGTIDLIYAGDYLGNVWRFDMRATTSAAWTAHKIFTATSSTGGSEPVMNLPLVVPHPDTIVGGRVGVVDKVVVVFATGTYIFKNDGSDTSEQSVYGIQDTLTSSYVTDRSKLIEQTQSAKVSGTSITRTLSSNPSPNGIIDFTTNDGWYVDLSDYRTGERVIREIFLAGGRVFAITEVPPSATECTINVGGFFLSFNPWYGTNISTPFFDLNHDGLINASDLNTDSTVPSGFAIMGSIPGGGAALCSGSTCTLATGVGTGITLTDFTNALKPLAGRVSWKELNN